MAEGEEMLSITEAAARIGVSRNSIQSAVREGRIPSEMRHGIRLLRASDVEAYRTRTQPEGKPRRGRPRKQQPDQGGAGEIPQ